MATESVADVTAHLASWCKRAGTDLALVEFDSELARERVVADLRARLTPIDIPFHELALSADGGPAEVVRELISELSSFEAGVVSISGFGQNIPLSGSDEGMVAAFNFQRERLAEPPVRQIWWLPSRVAETFLHGAPDLYSWFTSRLHLTEVIAPWPAARPPIESWIAEGFEATPTSLEDAQQRAAELAGRFIRALEDPEKPVTELALELMVPAVRALEEAGAVREAHELERDLRRRAREKQRPLPPRVFISYSHDSVEHMDRVLALADRLRDEGVDARLDQYEAFPPQGWQLWMEDEVEAADFVLVVATESYESRRRGREGKGKGLGVRFEGAIFSQTLYDNALHNETVIPVVFASSDMANVPVFLKAMTHYDLGSEDGYESLYRLLTDQPRILKAPLGQLRTLAPRERRQRFAVGLIWNVPHRRNHFFTGREVELRTLREVFHQEGSAALGKTQAISGLGGVGKTQIAVEYAYRYRDDYLAVLWLRAETEAVLASGISDLAAVLDLPERDVKSQELVVQAVKRWLESNASWLLVIDNVDSPELVEPFLPSAHQGHVLLTSRAWNLSRLIARPLRLNPLRRDEAVAFLLKRAIREDAGETQRLAAAELAIEVGNLPLALAQAAAYIHVRQSRFDDYLESYRARRLHLLESGDPGDYPASVATTWALNFDEVEGASVASAEILRLSAFLAPERIPVEILTLGASAFSSTLSTVLESVVDDPLVLDEMLEHLSRYSLIERDPESRSFSVHPMVQEVLRAGLDEEGQRRWAERAVRALNRAFPKVEVPSWPLCERFLLQATAALELVDRHGLELEPVADLFNRAGIYSWARGRYRQAIPFFERSLTIREEVLGPEHRDVAASLHNLANLYQSQANEGQAAKLYERSLEILERMLGPEHPDVATSLNSLAGLHRAQGDTKLAESLYQRALKIRKKVLGPEHPDVATSLHNLANLYRDQGEITSAVPLLERALEIQERMLGPEHPDVATSLHNLALLHRDQGENALAASLLERSLGIREKVLGPEHPDVATSLHNLANQHYAQKDYASAAPLYQRSLRIREKVLGSEHPHVATILNNLASLYRVQGDYLSAEPLYERALSSWENAHGPEHSHVAKVLENYALLLAETDRAEEAAEMEARAKTIRARRSGQDLNQDLR